MPVVRRSAALRSQGNLLAIRDNGRGMPVDPHPKLHEAVARWR
jgi:DNA gyrase/topoisomerase IV subunit B